MNIYTVRQINAYIKKMFSQDIFLHSVVVSGEVTGFKRAASGHLYFSLIEKNELLNVVVYQENAAKVSFDIKNGDKVEITGYIDIYGPRSEYQLKGTRIKLSGEGEGERHEELQKLIGKLSEMGMFSEEYKIPIPKYSFRVGVVTSATGSVIHDIMQTAEERNPGVEIILHSAKVQGDGAAASVIEGINALVNDNVDVIIIGRGGGSDEELSAFNDEALAHAVFDCTTPIVSAVGHGDHRSITDMVADAFAPTPTAAAVMTVFSLEEFIKDVDTRFATLDRMMQKHIDRKRHELKQRELRLDALSPSTKIKHQRLAYNNRVEKLETLMKKRLESSRSKLLIYIEKYKALSPVERIAHGFAAVTDKNGSRVTDVSMVNAGDPIRLTMKDGYIDATATAVKKRD